eukprot:7379990-Prymnesium_polylepis.1
MQTRQGIGATARAARQCSARELQRVDVRGARPREGRAGRPSCLTHAALEDRPVEALAVVSRPNERACVVECAGQPPLAVSPRLAEGHGSVLAQLGLCPAVHARRTGIDLAIRIHEPAKFGIASRIRTDDRQLDDLVGLRIQPCRLQIVRQRSHRLIRGRTECRAGSARSTKRGCAQWRGAGRRREDAREQSE